MDTDVSQPDGKNHGHEEESTKNNKESYTGAEGFLIFVLLICILVCCTRMQARQREIRQNPISNVVDTVVYDDSNMFCGINHVLRHFTCFCVTLHVFASFSSS